MKTSYTRNVGQQNGRKRLFIKISLIASLAIVLLSVALSMNVSKIQAHTAKTSAAQLAQSQALPADVVSTIYQVFGPTYGPGALHVAMCESTLNPQAYNNYAIGSSHAMGLFQVLYPSTWQGTSQSGSSPYDVAANIRAAHEIFVRDGYSWREWQCQP